MTAEFAIAMSQSLARLITDEPDASEAVFGLRLERRIKFTMNVETGNWIDRAMVVWLDADRRVLWEEPELGTP